MPSALGGRGVTNLKRDLFYAKSGIASVCILASIAYYGEDKSGDFYREYVFSCCYDLKEINVDSYNPSVPSMACCSVATGATSCHWYYRNSSSDPWKASANSSAKTNEFSFTALAKHSGHQSVHGEEQRGKRLFQCRRPDCEITWTTKQS